MLVQEVMTKDCKTCSSEDSLRAVAEMMASDGIGIVPVAKNDKLIGMVTDRDIVVRAVATGKDLASAQAGDFMSSKVFYLFDDQTVDEAATSMSQMQVRRLPVVDRDKRLVGMLSLGDLASHGAANKAKMALEGVSQS